MLTGMQQAAQAKSYQFELMKARQAHEFNMQELALKAQLDQGANAEKIAAEAEKAQIDLEGKAIQLETQKVKANADAQKAVAEETKAQNEMLNSIFGGNQ